jgi:hypothetical protein
MTTKAKLLPSQEYLIECLSYNEDTGIFAWNNRPLHHFNTKRGANIFNSRFANNITGYADQQGRIYIRIDGVKYMAHRIAWKIITGKDPSDQIDHINRNPSDNRFCNLREATNSENNCNKIAQSNNKSGYKGVFFENQSQKFKAKIAKNGKTHFVGYFDNPEEAHKSYCKKAKLLHNEFVNYGSV